MTIKNGFWDDISLYWPDVLYTHIHVNTSSSKMENVVLLVSSRPLSLVSWTITFRRTTKNTHISTNTTHQTYTVVHRVHVRLNLVILYLLQSKINHIKWLFVFRERERVRGRMRDKHQPHNVSTLMEYMDGVHRYIETHKWIWRYVLVARVHTHFHSCFVVLLACHFFLFHSAVFLFTFVSTTLFSYFFLFSSGQGCKVVSVHFACWGCFYRSTW